LGRGFVRFLILLPWVAPVSLGTIGWKWILDSIYSVITWVLVALHFYKPYGAPMWPWLPSSWCTAGGSFPSPQSSCWRDAPPSPRKFPRLPRLTARASGARC